jgi:ubiquilin
MSSTDAASSSADSNEIQINIKGPSELRLLVSITTDKTVLDLKKAVAEKSDVPAERQRLIYSGRVLKDEDILTTYKIANNHTVHMVKGAPKGPGESSSGTSGTAPQQLPNMQTGQNVHDPLTQLNSHLGFGALNQLGPNPFASMGLNANDPNMMQGIMDNPQFLQTMSSQLSNPAVIDQIIAMNPQLAGMGDQLRGIMQSERFREMMCVPRLFYSRL